MLKLLIFDPKNLWQPFLEKTHLDTTFAFSSEIVTTTKLTSKEPYDAFILFEKEHFEEALALAKKAQQHPLIFFVSEHRTAKSFERLKLEYGVDIVMQTPLVREEVSALLRFLEHKSSPQPQEELPPELVAQYQKSIYAKIERIEMLIKTSEKERSSLSQLITEVHKIAGSASSYGYGGASIACKAHELYLRDHQKNGSLEELYKRNSLFLRKLRLLFQSLNLQQEAIHLFAKKQEERSSANTLILISSDLPLIHRFQQLADQMHIPLIAESNPRTFRDRQRKEPLKAGAVIVEEYYPFTSLTGLALIEELKQEGDASMKFGVISDSDELDKRVAWVESEIAWVLKRPLTENNILQILQGLEEKERFPNTRALIVDDDEDLGVIETKLLEAMGIEVHYLKDERALFKTLDEFVPHLLLLDIHLPYFSGKQLLETLRADVRFQRMIIAIVTAFQEEGQEEWAYEKSCDTIIYKPIDPRYFQSRIANLLKRRMAVGLRTQLDPTTAMFHQEAFFHKVESALSQQGDRRCTLAFLEIDMWNQIASTLSATERKQVTILLANALKQQFERRALYGYLEQTRFALFFIAQPGGKVEVWLERFLYEMRSRIWLAGREDLHLTLSAGTALFGEGKVSLAQARTACENGLAQAHSRGGKCIEAIRLTESSVAQEESKQVFLVDDDRDLCAVIAYMFRKEGIDVHVFHTGQEAIDFIAKLKQVDHTMLFILDRILPDRDGITLLQIIKEKFPGEVKALFLTSLSTEKDILDGLKIGAVDYITKPFSVQVLLRKALALLNR